MGGTSIFSFLFFVVFGSNPAPATQPACLDQYIEEAVAITQGKIDHCKSLQNITKEQEDIILQYSFKNIQDCAIEQLRGVIPQLSITYIARLQMIIDISESIRSGNTQPTLLFLLVRALCEQDQAENRVISKRVANRRVEGKKTKTDVVKNITKFLELNFFSSIDTTLRGSPLYPQELVRFFDTEAIEYIYDSNRQILFTPSDIDIKLKYCLPLDFRFTKPAERKQFRATICENSFLSNITRTGEILLYEHTANIPDQFEQLIAFLTSMLENSILVK